MSDPPKNGFCVGCNGKCKVDHLEELLKQKVYSAPNQLEALRLLKQEMLKRTENFNKQNKK